MAVKKVNVDFFTGDYFFSTLTSGIFGAQNLSTDELDVQGDWRDNEVVGGGNNDTVRGAAGNDKLFGQGGDDRLFGGEGNDQLFGGADDDLLSGGSDRNKEGSLINDGRDLIDGGSGNDTATYDGFRGRISVTLAESGDSFVRQTGPAVNGIESDLGNDTLRGIENIVGAQGDDFIQGNSAANKIEGGFGNDLLLGGGGNDTLLGGTSNGADQGRDFLNGGSGDDLVMGGFGNDTIIGGQGADVLFGGFSFMELDGNIALGGNDTFVFQNDGLNVGFFLPGGTFTGDRVMDFSQGDQIDLSQIDADRLALGNQQFQFADAFSGRSGQLVVNLVNDAAGFDQWLIAGDTNGDRIADFNMLVTAQNGLNLESTAHIIL